MFSVIANTIEIVNMLYYKYILGYNIYDLTNNKKLYIKVRNFNYKRLTKVEHLKSLELLNNNQMIIQ